MFLVEDNCNKKCNERHNESESSKCKHIECLIIGSSKLSIDVINSYTVEKYFKNGRNNKHLLMYSVEKNKKYKITKRKKEHMVLSVYMSWV